MFISKHYIIKINLKGDICVKKVFLQQKNTNYSFFFFLMCKECLNLFKKFKITFKTQNYFKIKKVLKNKP